jgi:hypothetical protein
LRLCIKHSTAMLQQTLLHNNFRYFDHRVRKNTSHHCRPNEII